MSNGRCILTLGNNGEIVKPASYLAGAFYNNSSVRLCDLTDDACFSGIEAKQLNKVVVYGTGGAALFGGYSASEFAALFSKRFMEVFAEADKLQVRDLYLVGCDTGLIKSDDGASSAQEIANLLQKKGFQNIVVHCLAKPDNAKDDVLHVEVISCTGVAAGLAAMASAIAYHCENPGDMQTGYLKAYLLPQEDEKTFRQLEKNKNKNSREISKLLHEKSFMLANHVHPELELNKPYNVFYPNESPEMRHARLEKNETNYSAAHAEAIALLTRRSIFLSEKTAFKDIMIARKLNLLVRQLRASTEHQWPYLINDYLRYLKNHNTFSRFIADDAATEKLLTALGKKDVKTAKKIVETQDQAPKEVKTNRVMTMFKAKPIPAAAPRQTYIPYELVARIHQLSQELQDEIFELRSRCFSFFYLYEINTKVAKLQVVDALKACNTLVAAQAIAKTAMSNERVMRSKRHARTSDLLHDIDQVTISADSIQAMKGRL